MRRDCGAEYHSEFEVEGPIIENNSVVGIFGKDREKKHVEIRAKIVIDALGIATILRRKLPENAYVDREVDIADVESTGRYIYEVEIDHEDLDWYDEKNALIHLNQNIAPGGYGWVFPKSNHKVNIGIGVQKASLDLRNAEARQEGHAAHAHGRVRQDESGHQEPEALQRPQQREGVLVRWRSGGRWTAWSSTATWEPATAWRCPTR